MSHAIDFADIETGPKGVARYSPILHYDMPPEFLEIFSAVRYFTLTTIERIYAVYTAVRHILAADVPGAFVECGVWRGGSTMAAMLTLQACGCSDRDVYLYDTFAGMTAPGENDWVLDKDGNRISVAQVGVKPVVAPLDEVKTNIEILGYAGHTYFVEGAVEDTIPAVCPDRIALLRLDTDWYESTRHELVHLYPRLSDGGILIVDDYGHFEGARKAVDEYFKEHGLHVFLSRIDCTGRLLVKHGGP